MSAFLKTYHSHSKRAYSGEDISIMLSNSPTKTDQSQITITEFNATENMGNNTDNHIGNNGKHQNTTNNIDGEEIAQNNRLWWKHISSMSILGALLPGKPMLMGPLIPIKSSKIIRKVMDKIPVRSDYV